MDITDKILKAAEYIENGDPLKDVLCGHELEDAILKAAELVLKNKDLSEDVSNLMDYIESLPTVIPGDFLIGD